MAGNVQGPAIGELVRLRRLEQAQVGEGPASRLLLLAIEGDEPGALAQASRALAAAIVALPYLALNTVRLPDAVYPAGNRSVNVFIPRKRS